jgi:hypothetical protein
LLRCLVERWRGLTNGDAQAVEANEVLTAVAAGELLAVTASGTVGLGVDADLGVAIGSTTLGSGVGEGGHGGDEESLEEGHFVGLGWLVKGCEKRMWLLLEVKMLLDDEKKLCWAGRDGVSYTILRAGLFVLSVCHRRLAISIVGVL